MKSFTLLLGALALSFPIHLATASEHCPPGAAIIASASTVSCTTRIERLLAGPVAPVLRAELVDEIVNVAQCGSSPTIKFVDVRLVPEAPEKTNRRRLDVPNRRTDPPRGGGDAPNGRKDVPNRRVDVPRPHAETPEERTKREEIQLITDSFTTAALGRYPVQIIIDQRSCSDAMGFPALVASGIIVLPRGEE